MPPGPTSDHTNFSYTYLVTFYLQTRSGRRWHSFCCLQNYHKVTDHKASTATFVDVVVFLPENQLVHPHICVNLITVSRSTVGGIYERSMSIQYTNSYNKDSTEIIAMPVFVLFLKNYETAFTRVAYGKTFAPR